MKILGISAFYHDAAAALICDGEIVAAMQEERFTRLKHDASFPVNAIRASLEEGECTLSDIDYVVYYEKPLLKFERLLETYLAFAPRGFRSFRRAIPTWIKEKLFLQRLMRKKLGELPGAYRKPIVYTRHHESHAASAFFPSPFDEAAILTADGVGAWATTSIGVGNGAHIKMLEEQRFPHSLGLLYSAFTYYCGFRVNSGEYKLMGLAPYGQPRFRNLIEKHLIHICEDGSFRMNMRFFNYCQGLTMTSRRFHKLFGRPPRTPESDIDEFYMDIAASIQKVVEEAMLRLARHAHEVTGCKSLCLAGGVALNCVANGRIQREGPFEQIWVQSASGDAGGALGAALFAWYQLLENPRSPQLPDAMRMSLLGPQFSQTEVEAFLSSKNINFYRAASEQDLCDRIASELAAGKVVGWFQGRMEFGPRALGNRSILADPRSPEMQRILNLKIKFRESFRPFAPSIMREYVQEYFDTDHQSNEPYMLFVTTIRDAHRIDDPETSKNIKGLDKLKLPRSTLPAITHVDATARLQTVDANQHPLYYKLLAAFKSLTDCPVLINTSFNVRGEPIVCAPEDAWKVFQATDMDVLTLGRCIVLKEGTVSKDQV